MSSETNYLLNSYKQVQDSNDKSINKSDPTKCFTIDLGTDYYSLTWACMRKCVFIDEVLTPDGKIEVKYKKQLRGQDIFLLPYDFFIIYMKFILFTIMLTISLILVIKEVVVDDEYVEGSFEIIICRVVLMWFAMNLLTPEFSTGYSKYLYASKFRNEFTFPEFAVFAALTQVITTGITAFTIILFICTRDDFASLLTNFSALCVLAELDNWLGDCILCNQIKNEPEDESKWHREHFDLENLNSRISVNQKMAMIDAENDLLIVINENIADEMFFMIKYFNYVNKFIPWDVIFPLLTIPLSYFMVSINQYLKKLF